MDYVAVAQAECPPAIVTQLQAIGRGGTDAAADTTLNLFNEIVAQPECRAAVLTELLRRLPRTSSDRYAGMLMSELQLQPQSLSPETRRDIAEVLQTAPVQPGWEREALLAFIALDIDRRKEFAIPDGRPVFGSTAFRASPVWNRALYAANFGDTEASKRIAEMMDSVTSAPILPLMFDDLTKISANQAVPLISRFSNDQRLVPSGLDSGAGLTVGDHAELGREFLDMQQAE